MPFAASPSVMRSRAERNRLVEENLGIARSVAGRSPGDFDDSFSVATLGLLRAAERWNPEKGTFAAYAFKCARWAVSKHRRRYRSLVATPQHAPEHASDAWLDAPVANGSDATHLDGLADEDAPQTAELVEVSVRDAAVRDAVNTLPEKERTAIEALYLSGGDGLTLEEAGATMAITREGARGREKSAFQLLERRLAPWG